MTNFEYYKEQFKRIYGDNIEIQDLYGKCFSEENGRIVLTGYDDCDTCMFQKQCNVSEQASELETERWLNLEYEQDNVNHPSHYTSGKIETKELYKLMLTTEERRGGFKMNIIKYLTRYQHKNGVEDLKKLSKYVEFLIELEESEQANGKD